MKLNASVFNIRRILPVYILTNVASKFQPMIEFDRAAYIRNPVLYLG